MKRKKDKFTVTEVGTLVEQFRGEFRVFGERQKSIIEKLDATYEQVVKNTERITLLEIAARDIISKLEALTTSIDNLVKTKADHEELKVLEKRIAALENKVAALS